MQDSVYDDVTCKKYLGKNIAKYRTEIIKIKREEFMQHLNCSYCTVENIESGKSYPSLATMKYLADFSNKPIYSYAMKYSMNVDSRDKEFIQDCTTEEKIELLMRTEYEKYNLLDMFQMDRIREMAGNTDSMNYVLLGYLIQFERRKRKMGRARLAELLRCEKKSLGNIESGNSMISFQRLLCLCNIFEVPVDYFLVGYLKNKEHAIDYMVQDILDTEDRDEKEFLKKFLLLQKCRMKGEIQNFEIRKID